MPYVPPRGAALHARLGGGPDPGRQRQTAGRGRMQPQGQGLAQCGEGVVGVLRTTAWRRAAWRSRQRLSRGRVWHVTTTCDGQGVCIKRYVLRA